MAHVISSWHSDGVYGNSLRSYVNAIKNGSNLSFNVFSFLASVFEFNVGSYSLKPRLTQYTNTKNFVTSAKWALFSEPVTYTAFVIYIVTNEMAGFHYSVIREPVIKLQYKSLNVN